MAERLYDVRAPRFGPLIIVADTIAEARRIARRYGADSKGAVTARLAYRHCERCDSRPCCCRGGSDA
jgi:hypothetical protein